MSSKLYFCTILLITIAGIRVNCFSIYQQRSLRLNHEQVTKGQFYVNRLKRQIPPLGNKNFLQAAAVQPSVVVMPSGVPSTVYRGVPSSSYGVQSSPYRVNSAPTVVVNMPDDNFITPMDRSPYVVPSRRF